MTDELLQKFMQHGDDYLSYSDDLVKAMGKSTDNVDNMIKLVSDFGDTAENAIVKSGDHAVDIYERFGENGLKAVANYGDDAVEVIYDYGSEAVTSLNKGIDPASVKKIYNWDYRPNDDLYIEYKNVFDNNKYYDQTTGQVKWPGQYGDVNTDGFLNGEYHDVKLSVGKEIDRYGSNNGTFFGETGTPIEKRAMAPTSDFDTYNQYIVKKELPVREGTIATWFDEPGLGTQYMLDPIFVDNIRRQLINDETLIDGLVRLKYLDRVIINPL